MKKRNWLKKVLGIFLTAALAAALAACGSTDSADLDDSADSSADDSADSSSSSDETITITVGTQATNVELYLEEAYGFFEEAFAEEGIEIEFINFESGPAITEALASGSLDIGTLADLPVLTAASSDYGVTIIGKTAGILNSIALIVPTGSDIDSVEDLEGKTIAYTVGSAGHAFLVKLLESAGLTENDIEGISVTNPEMEATLVSGDVDAVVSVGSFIYSIENNGEGTVLVDNTDIYEPVSALVASDTFIEEHPDLVVKYLEIWSEVVEYAEENIDEVYEALAEQQDISVDYYERFTLSFDIEWTDADYETLDVTENFLVSNDLVAKEIDPADYVDLSFLEEALGE